MIPLPPILLIAAATAAQADLRLDTLAIDFESPKIMGHWEEIMNRINSGDMPPDDVDKRPQPDDIARVAEWIAGQLHEAEAARQSSGSERVAFRKLSREEYANTIRDLLGVTFDVADPGGLPEDPDWHGFQRIFFGGDATAKDLAYARKIVARFAERAWRRPGEDGGSGSPGETRRAGAEAWRQF